MPGRLGQVILPICRLFGVKISSATDFMGNPYCNLKHEFTSNGCRVSEWSSNVRVNFRTIIMLIVHLKIDVRVKKIYSQIVTPTYAYTSSSYANN